MKHKTETPSLQYENGPATMHRFTLPSPVVPPRATPFNEEQQPDSLPFPELGRRAYFFDAFATYQPVRWGRVEGTIIEYGSRAVRLELDDGQRTECMPIAWITEVEP